MVDCLMDVGACGEGNNSVGARFSSMVTQQSQLLEDVRDDSAPDSATGMLQLVALEASRCGAVHDYQLRSKPRRVV